MEGECDDRFLFPFYIRLWSTRWRSWLRQPVRRMIGYLGASTSWNPSFTFLSTVVFILRYMNGHKANVSSKGYHVIIISSICVNRMVRPVGEYRDVRLEGEEYLEGVVEVSIHEDSWYGLSQLLGRKECDWRHLNTFCKVSFRCV